MRGVGGSTRRWPWVAAAAALLLIALAGILAGKAWVRSSFVAAEAAHDLAARTAAEADYRRYAAPIIARADALRARNAPREQWVAALPEFAEGAPGGVGINSEGASRALTYREANSGWRFEVRFDVDGRFVFGHWQSPPAAKPGFDRRPWERYGAVVGLAADAACVVWLILAIVAVAVGRSAAGFAWPLLLAVAVFAAGAGAVDASPRRVFRGDLATVRFGVRCGMIPVSAAIVLWARRRGSGRATSSACRRCGYDLTGNESGRCPECGTYVKLTPDTSAEIAARLGERAADGPTGDA